MSRTHRTRDRRRRPAAGRGPQGAFPDPPRLPQAHRRPRPAVDGVSLDIRAGETLSARRRMRLRQDHARPGAACACSSRPTGSILYRARTATPVDLAHLEPSASCGPIRADIRMIFQDPFASLNPRRRVIDIIGEPLRNFGVTDEARGRGTGRRPAAPGRPAARIHVALPVRLLRRRAAAHRHRPGARGAPELVVADEASRRSTSRSRRRPSTCCRTCRRSSTSPTSSSRTTSASSSTSPTGSR